MHIQFLSIYCGVGTLKNENGEILEILPALRRTPWCVLRKDRNKLVNFVLLCLQDTFADPNQITNFLFLELDIGVENGIVHLALKGQLEHLNIALIESIVDTLLTRAIRVDVPDRGILREELEDAAELILVSNVGQHGSAGRVKVTDGGVETRSVRRAHGGLVERSSEGVQGYVDSVGISADPEELSHDDSRLPAELVDELSKVLNPVLDEGRLDDLNLDLLQYIARPVSGTLLQEHSKVRSNGSVYKDRLVKIGVAFSVRFKGGNATHGTLLEHSERVTLRNELINITSTQGSLEKKHDVLDHVFVGDKVKKGRKRLHSLCPQVLEFCHQL